MAVPAKLEGVAFGPDVEIAGGMKRTLFLATVTDALHPLGIENPTQWFVFTFGDHELRRFQPQVFTPRPTCDGDRD